MSLKRSTNVGSQSQKSLGRSGTTAAPIDPLDPSQLDVNVIGWNHLEQKFQELRGLLSAPAQGLNAHEARAQQKRNVSNAIVQLLDRAQQDCRRLLVEGNAKAAVEGGLKTLRLKESYYGHGHLQLVPAYFHLARTNQYMDKFKAAEEFLSLAQWTILRNKDVDVSLKAELHQTFGLLYASDAKLDAALKQLTSATYYLCVMNGPEHILTSFGYFDLGNVFAAKSNMEHAMAFYDKVKDIWYQHLTTALRLALEPNADDIATEESGSKASDMLVAAHFGIENLQDAVKMLRGIVGLQTERYGRVHPSTARAEFVLGMFMLWNGDAPSATGSLLKALEISKRVFGDRHPNTGEVRSLMLNFHLEIPEDTSYVLEDGYEGETAKTQSAQASYNEPAPAQRVPTPPTESKHQSDSPRRQLSPPHEETIDRPQEESAAPEEEAAPQAQEEQGVEAAIEQVEEPEQQQVAETSAVDAAPETNEGPVSDNVVEPENTSAEVGAIPQEEVPAAVEESGEGQVVEEAATSEQELITGEQAAPEEVTDEASSPVNEVPDPSGAAEEQQPENQAEES